MTTVTTACAPCFLRLAVLVLACAACASRQHVAILSTGRSGSTLLMELLASLPNTVYYFEPYFNFAHHDEHVSPIPIHDAAIPRMAELYDCERMIRDGRIQSITSLFACEGTAWIAETPAEVEACKSGVINIERSLSRCLSSSRMVVKATKLPWLTIKLNSTAVIPRDVKVIHLVRHPAAVLRSQYSAGWDVLYPRVGSLSALESLGVHICSEMLVTAHALEQLEPANVITVRYEDMIAQFDETMLQVLAFLDIKPTDEVLARFQHVRALSSYAGLPRHPDKTATPESAAAAVAQSEMCRYVTDLYYSAPMPHSEL